MSDKNFNHVMDESYDSWEAWLASRPACVQALAIKFPPMTQVLIEGVTYYVFAYNEAGQLVVSSTDPIENYDKALATKKYLWAAHLDPL